MEIKLIRRENEAVMLLNGRLDSNTSPEAEQVFVEALEEYEKLTLDFTNLLYISSMGLRVLLTLLKKASAIGGELIVANARPEVIEIFEMTGFSAMLNLM